MAPQLTQDGSANPIDLAGGCRPSMQFTLFTAIVPNGIALVSIIAGWAETPDGRAHSLSYIGCLIASLGSTWFWVSTGNWSQVGWSIACGMCYAVGMVLYVRTKPLSNVWGYHEWMHVCVTMGFLLNIVGVDNIARTCPTGQWPTPSDVNQSHNAGVETPLAIAFAVAIVTRILIRVGNA